MTKDLELNYKTLNAEHNAMENEFRKKLVGRDVKDVNLVMALFTQISENRGRIETAEFDKLVAEQDGNHHKMHFLDSMAFGMKQINNDLEITL